MTDQVINADNDIIQNVVSENWVKFRCELIPEFPVLTDVYTEQYTEQYS